MLFKVEQALLTYLALSQVTANSNILLSMAKPHSVNIRVFARFRPPMVRENGIDTSTFQVETLEGKSVRIYRELQEPLLFNLDMVFQSSIQQNEIFDLVGKHLVEDAIAGYNVAYIQH